MDQPVGEGKVPGCWVKLFWSLFTYDYASSQNIPKLVILLRGSLMLAFFPYCYCIKSSTTACWQLTNRKEIGYTFGKAK